MDWYYLAQTGAVAGFRKHGNEFLEFKNILGITDWLKEHRLTKLSYFLDSMKPPIVRRNHDLVTGSQKNVYVYYNRNCQSLNVKLPCINNTKLNI